MKPGRFFSSKNGNALAVFQILVAFTSATAAEALHVASTVNSDTIPLYDVFEISFRHDREYANPFFDVSIHVVFHSPSRKRIGIGGFHYGSSDGPLIRPQTGTNTGGARPKIQYQFIRQDLWKARFAPSETGRWTYDYVLTNVGGGRAVGSSSFDCVKSRTPLHGFMRPNPDNPFLWILDDGTPFFPIGLQECIDDNARVGSVLAAQSMEGPFRLDRSGRPELPPGRPLETF